jgi:dipeptide/tripeptide permease
VFVVIFGIVFVGMIIGFFWYLWMNERKRKSGGDEPGGTRGAG